MKNAQGNYYNTRADDYDDHLRSRNNIDKIMIGTLALGSLPIALTEGVGALTTAGDAASDYVMGTKWGQLINNGLKTVSAAKANTPWWPYVDTAVDSASITDGINNVAHGNINLDTASEFTPLVRVGKGAEKVASYLTAVNILSELRELLTKYPMFTGAVVTGTGYQTTKHKNGGKMKIHIKKKNKGKFTTYCGGTVTQACINRAKASGNTTLVKRATFAEVSRTWRRK